MCPECRKNHSTYAVLEKSQLTGGRVMRTQLPGPQTRTDRPVTTSETAGNAASLGRGRQRGATAQAGPREPPGGAGGVSPAPTCRGRRETLQSAGMDAACGNGRKRRNVEAQLRDVGGRTRTDEKRSARPGSLRGDLGGRRVGAGRVGDTCGLWTRLAASQAHAVAETPHTHDLNTLLNRTSTVSG